MAGAVDISDLPAPPPDISDLPAPPKLDDSWLGAAKAVGDAGMSGANKLLVGGLGSVARTANRLIPEWLGGPSRAEEEAKINAVEKAATYEPQSPEGQDLANNVGNFIKPVGQAISKGLGYVVGDDNVGAVTDALATVGMPGARAAVGTAGKIVRAGVDAAADSRIGRGVQGAVDEVKANRAGQTPAPPEAPKPTSGAFTAEDLAPQPSEAPVPVSEPTKADVAPAPKAAPKASEPILTTLDADGAAQYTPEQRAQVKQRLEEKLTQDPAAARAEYAAARAEYAAARAEYAAHPDTMGGKVLSTDIARDLSPDYNAGKEARSALAAEVHEPASQFVKDLYAEKLAEAPKPGEQPTVLFTAGGTGAGKTTGIDNIPGLSKIRDQAQIVYDTNMNKLESARTKIDQALTAGKDVRIAYVYRDPVEAFANGTLPRAERQGRTVPIEEQSKTHAGSYETVGKLQEHYADDPRVTFTTVDNSRGKGKSAVVPFSALQGKRYNATADELRPVVENALQNGKISKRVYDGTVGQKAGVQGSASGTGESSRTVAGASEAGASVGNVGGQNGPRNGGNVAPENGGAARSEAGAADARGAQAPGANRGSGSKGAPEALNHPLEFLPPEAEGTKSKAVPATEQASRADTLRQLGLKEVRTSALSGDYKETGTDFQTSKLDHSGGKRMNAVMEDERQALRDYSEGLVDRSGGTAETDAIARRNRGQTIAAPIEDYNAALEAETKKLYAVADQRAAGLPIELKGVGNILTKEKAAFLGTTEGKQLLEGVTARAKELGLLGDNEVFHPATVEQAERLRQYLNDNYSPRAGKLIAKLKDAIDEDVTRVAGADVYAAGRKIRAARSANLEEPTGVSKLLGPDDRLGINREVAHEDVPKYVTSLSSDQFGHVVRVLKDAGKNSAIAPKAAAALNEIRATFANAVRDAGESTQGMWNAKAVNKYLRDNSARMEQVFSPEEMRQYKTLNDGGRILRMDRSYPGAAAQSHNFVVNGVIKGAEHGATAAGAVMGHIPGAIAGHAISRSVKALDSRAVSAAVEKRITTLNASAARTGS